MTFRHRGPVTFLWRLAVGVLSHLHDVLAMGGPVTVWGSVPEGLAPLGTEQHGVWCVPGWEPPALVKLALVSEIAAQK